MQATKFKLAASLSAVLSLVFVLNLNIYPAASQPAKARAGQARKVPAKTVIPTVRRHAVKLKMEVPCRAWTPTTVPKVVLLCVHGLGLNSESYEQFGRRMSKMGVATFAVDVRGFGSWMRLAGKQEVDFKECLNDVKKALILLHTAYPKVPIFVLGESMGGAIALRVTADYPELVDGLISAVPSGDRFHKTKNELRVALRMVTFSMDKPMEVGSGVIKDATDDPAVAERWKDDPLNRMALTPKELMQFQKFMNENHETAKKIDRKPVLVIAGFKDKLVRPQGTIDLFNEITTPDKMLLIVGNGEHLIFEENEMTDQVASLLIAWLNSHLGARTTAYVPPVAKP